MTTTPPKSPFAALAALRATLPAGPAPRTPAGGTIGTAPTTATAAGRTGAAPATTTTTAAAPAAPSPFGGKVVVSRSRKGRGGRTVTVIAGVRGGEAVLDGLCRELKRALGCGASVEGETIVVSGDLIERVKKWLEDAGAKKVIVGT